METQVHLLGKAKFGLEQRQGVLQLLEQPKLSQGDGPVRVPTRRKGA